MVDLLNILIFINELILSITAIFANSEDSDEIRHKGAFHQSLYCLLRQNTINLGT